MTNVKGRWVLITGASRGIGLQIVRFMANQGANLILQSRSNAHTMKIADEVRALGVDVKLVEAELSDLEQVNKMLAEIDSLGVDVEIIFNNAGVQIAYRNEFFKTPADDFTQSFIINTIAPAMICYHFIPKMIKRGFGRVINTSSGIRHDPQQAGYSASKAALNKFTIDLATKLDGTDVMLNINDPGWCRTDLGGQHAPNSPESVIPGIVVGAFLDDKISGRYLSAQDFSGMTLDEAVNKAKCVKRLDM